MTKGILIIFMLAHHVFYPDQLAIYEINTLFDNQNRVIHLITFLKYALPAFLSSQLSA